MAAVLRALFVFFALILAGLITGVVARAALWVVTL
jgi:hypothetical protein